MVHEVDDIVIVSSMPWTGSEDLNSEGTGRTVLNLNKISLCIEIVARIILPYRLNNGLVRNFLEANGIGKHLMNSVGHISRKVEITTTKIRIIVLV